ncbi:MAG: hypothetical protein IJV81_01140 [Paludibacteraceae bacterium]|nr:hypothetical protein [Paludibacteraceae bacterium]MBR2936175.1 hypothetical protein [Paludibacteraceae bacterium]
MILPKNRQSMLDIAMEHSGTTEAAWDIAQTNGLSLTDDLKLEPMLKPAITNQRIVTNFLTLRHSPATGITNAEINQQLGAGEGIEFWAIEYDFVVS